MKVYNDRLHTTLLDWDTPAEYGPTDPYSRALCVPQEYVRSAAEYKLDWDTVPPKKYKECGTRGSPTLRLYEGGRIFVPPAMWDEPDNREYFKEVTRRTAVVMLHSELPQTELPDGTPVTKKYLQGYYKSHNTTPGKYPSSTLRSQYVIVDLQHNYILPLSTSGFYIPKQGYRPCPHGSQVWWDYLPVTRESLKVAKQLLQPLQETGKAMVTMQGCQQLPRTLHDDRMPWIKDTPINVFGDKRYAAPSKGVNSHVLTTRITSALAEDIIGDKMDNWTAAHYMATAILSQDMTWGASCTYQQLFTQIIEQMHTRIRAPFLRLR